MSERRSKYGAVRIDHGDHRHDSRKEASRCVVLTLRQDAGEIRALRQQVRFDFVVNGVRVGWYRADFQYEQQTGDAWELVVEDTKSPATRKLHGWGRTKRLMLALYGLKVREP